MKALSYGKLNTVTSNALILYGFDECKPCQILVNWIKTDAIAPRIPFYYISVNTLSAQYYHVSTFPTLEYYQNKSIVETITSVNEIKEKLKNN
jgi:hypothetical protein